MVYASWLGIGFRYQHDIEGEMLHGWLYFYRSWSGYRIYGARLTETPTGGFLSKAWVNADKKQYKAIEPEEEEQLIKGTIAEFLLSRPR